MKTRIVILLTIILTSCRHSATNENNNSLQLNSVIESRMLEKKIDALIKSNDSDDRKKIYVVRFASNGTNSYIIIYETYYYNKDAIDGYFFKDKNLVVFYNIDKLKEKGILNKENLLEFKDSIPNYKDISECDMQFETYQTKFKIVTPDSLVSIDDLNPLYRKL